jgi:flagellar basal body rod protein FlgG
VAQSSALEVTATNLANTQNAGYQRLRPVFHEVLGKAQAKDLRAAQLKETVIDTSAQGIRTTGRALDAALPAGTYLAIRRGGAEQYTRAVRLHVAADGALQTDAGDAVLGEQGEPLRSPNVNQAASLSENGELMVAGAKVGRLRVVKFETAEKLQHAEGSSMLATTESGEAQLAPGKLTVGALSDSNASVIGGMNDLVAASRTFESFQRALDVFHATEKAASRIAAT